MRSRGRFPCTFAKACHCHWAIREKRWTMTAAAIVLELNVGTVSHVFHRHRFPGAFPVPGANGFLTGSIEYLDLI